MLNLKSRLCVVFLIAVLFAACKGAGLKKVDVDQKAQFSGSLQYDLFYGAPGFGEDTVNDEKEPCYMLHLDQPFLFRDTAFASEFGISADSCGYDTVNMIQVRFDPMNPVNGKNLKKLVGKKITLECTLYGAHTGHHHAPALTEKVYDIKQLLPED